MLFLERSVAQPKATIFRFYFTKTKLIGEFRFVEERKRDRKVTSRVSWRSKQDRGAFPSPEKGLLLGGE